MKILKILSLRGPNIWANFPVLEAWVDLEELKDSPSDELPGFNDRLMSWLPSMIEHRCSIGERGGFFERLRRGTWPGHILEHVTLELQSLAGSEAGYGRARETSQEGVYKVVVEYQDEDFAKACMHAGLELVLAAIYDRPYDVQAEVKRLSELNQEMRLGPSTRAIVDAAVRRGIPSRRLSEGNLVQFGYGACQRRIQAGETDRTSAIAESIAQDKELTRSLLRSVGVPTPEGRDVADADDAWEAAQEIGGPVVVKPRYGNQGRGVAANLTTEEQVRAAYAAARQEGSSIVVEEFIPGDDHRLLVIGDKLAAAARREPAHVIGDGMRTVAELVAQVNADPRRGSDHATSLSRIRIDDIALGVLSEQQLTSDSIPAAGQKVLIRRNANLSTGGTAADVTDLVHPEVAARAIDAAKAVGLDIAGIDVLAVDISRPLEEQNGAIVEVNAGPGLRMHVQPSSGAPRPVGEAIVDLMFAPGETGRDSDRGRDGLERQNHHHAVHLAPVRVAGQSGRHDVHRRHFHRPAADRNRRLQRTEKRSRRADESARRSGRAGNGAGRNLARRVRLRPVRRGGRYQPGRRRSPGRERHSDGGRSGPRQANGGRGAGADGHGRAQSRRSAGRGNGRKVPRLRPLLLASSGRSRACRSSPEKRPRTVRPRWHDDRRGRRRKRR